MDSLKISRASRDITPDKRVVLGAQFKMRISEGVDGPVTVTASDVRQHERPDLLWYKEAEERMLKLRGLTMRQGIGRRVELHT